MPEPAKPIYHVNITHCRKLGIYRLSFLEGRKLASFASIVRIAVGVVRDKQRPDTARVYSGKWSEIASASHRWMAKNKDV